MDELAHPNGTGCYPEVYESPEVKAMVYMGCILGTESDLGYK